MTPQAKFYAIFSVICFILALLLRSSWTLFSVILQCAAIVLALAAFLNRET